MPRTSTSKPSRLNIRVSEHEKDVLMRAASALNTSVSSFVVQRAYAEAQVILAEQSQFAADFLEPGRDHLEQVFPRLGGGHAAGRARQEPDPQPFFQLAHGPAQRRLRNVEF